MVEVIPRYKDYPSLKAERGNFYRFYKSLVEIISAKHQKFVDVTERIRENNAKSRVKPMNCPE